MLTRNPEYQVKGAEVVHTVEEALELISEYPPEDVYVIGGDTIYRQFLPYCDVAHVTRIVMNTWPTPGSRTWRKIRSGS